MLMSEVPLSRQDRPVKMFLVFMLPPKSLIMDYFHNSGSFSVGRSIRVIFKYQDQVVLATYTERSNDIFHRNLKAVSGFNPLPPSGRLARL